jgi:hypothetical protein
MFKCPHCESETYEYVNPIALKCLNCKKYIIWWGEFRLGVETIEQTEIDYWIGEDSRRMLLEIKSSYAL